MAPCNTANQEIKTGNAIPTPNSSNKKVLNEQQLTCVWASLIKHNFVLHPNI